MMKKHYCTPFIKALDLGVATIVCNSGDEVTNINSGDTDIEYAGGGNGPARARSYNLWDDEE